MAEEKKTSPKAEKKADKPAKSTKSKDKKSKKNPFKSIASFFKSVKAGRLFGHRQKMSLKTLLLFLL